MYEKGYKHYSNRRERLTEEKKYKLYIDIKFVVIVLFAAYVSMNKALIECSIEN